MIEFISQNKEWLFSGIGVAIFVTLLGLFRKAKNNNGGSQVIIHLHNDAKGQEIEIQEIEPTSIEKISSLSFESMRDAIEASPPLQRDDVKKNFVGIKIEWDTCLKSAKKDGEFVRLTLTSAGEYMVNTIWCKVLLSEYKELGILPEGANIRVHGEIEEAGTWDVELKNVSLFFYE